jgi:GTP-binding protein
MREVAWRNQRFTLVDTGGICNVDGEIIRDRIEQGIHAQVDAALQDAALALLVVDVDAGVTPLDELVVEKLRASGCTTLVAANKADNAAKADAAIEFEQFGLPLFPVSALHDRGTKPLLQAILERLPEGGNRTLAEPLLVTVVGRPNVGKSSYVNRLLRSDRVIVSDVPGTTRDSIDVPFSVGQGDQARQYVLIDTAGIRRKGKIDSSVERFGLFRAERSVGRANVVVLVLDASCGVTAQDRRIASLALERGKGCVLLVNKWDLSEETQRQSEPEIRRALPFMAHVPLVFVSSKSGYNVRHSVEVIDSVAAQTRAELPTGILNRVLVDACERVHPPTVKGRALKVFYATQVGREPIRIRVFVNDLRLVRETYTAYLIKNLRSHFGLEGAPVLIQYRARRRTDRKPARSRR